MFENNNLAAIWGVPVFVSPSDVDNQSEAGEIIHGNKLNPEAVKVALIIAAIVVAGALLGAGIGVAFVVSGGGFAAVLIPSSLALIAYCAGGGAIGAAIGLRLVALAGSIHSYLTQKPANPQKPSEEEMEKMQTGNNIEPESELEEEKGEFRYLTEEELEVETGEFIDDESNFDEFVQISNEFEEIATEPEIPLCDEELAFLEELKAKDKEGTWNEIQTANKDKPSVLRSLMSVSLPERKNELEAIYKKLLKDYSEEQTIKALHQRAGKHHAGLLEALSFAWEEADDESMKLTNILLRLFDPNPHGGDNPIGIQWNQVGNAKNEFELTFNNTYEFNTCYNLDTIRKELIANQNKENPLENSNNGSNVPELSIGYRAALSTLEAIIGKDDLIVELPSKMTIELQNVKPWAGDPYKTIVFKKGAPKVKGITVEQIAIQGNSITFKTSALKFFLPSVGMKALKFEKLFAEMDVINWQPKTEELAG